MHTFTKLPVIRPIKIQMHASKYGTKSPDQTYHVELVHISKLLVQPQKTCESRNPFLVVPVKLKVINEPTAVGFRLIASQDHMPMRKSCPFLNISQVIGLVPQTWVKGNGPVIR